MPLQIGIPIQQQQIQQQIQSNPIIQQQQISANNQQFNNTIINQIPIHQSIMMHRWYIRRKIENREERIEKIIYTYIYIFIIQYSITTLFKNINYIYLFVNNW